MREESSCIEFSTEELTSLTHMLHNAAIFSCDYDAAISGIRKLKKELEERENGKRNSSRERSKVNRKR
jgi:hypothetical protein